MSSHSVRSVDTRSCCWEEKTGTPMFPLRPQRELSSCSTRLGEEDPWGSRVNSGSILKVRSARGGINSCSPKNINVQVTKPSYLYNRSGLFLELYLLNKYKYDPPRSDIPSIVLDQWPIVLDQWPIVLDQWPIVSDHWPTPLGLGK